jgi:hypothetical protein
LVVIITSEWATRESVKDMVLRQADLSELSITRPGVPAAKILAEAVDVSQFAELVRVDGRPAVVYGVAPTHLYGMGSVWMLASDDINLMRRYFLRHCREKVDMMNRMFPVLANYVHADNTVSINWLAWCGFDVYQPDVHGLCYFSKGVN